MKRSWNVTDELPIELYVDEDGSTWDTDDNDITSILDLTVLGLEDAELVIEFTSEGYYDSGSMYGGPDNLGYPPEGDDERLLSEAYLCVNGERIKTFCLTKQTQQNLFDRYEDNIQDVEVDTDYEPDYC